LKKQTPFPGPRDPMADITAARRIMAAARGMRARPVTAAQCGTAGPPTTAELRGMTDIPIKPRNPPDTPILRDRTIRSMRGRNIIPSPIPITRTAKVNRGDGIRKKKRGGGDSAFSLWMRLRKTN